MTSPTNPANVILTDADWQRLSQQTREYVVAGYDLMGRAEEYLRDGDLRQASEKGWGAAAQIVKAVAEHWKDHGVTHGRHQDLRALVNGLASSDRVPDLHMMFQAAQELHENFYENNAPEYIVQLDLAQTHGFIARILPYLRRTQPPQGFRQGR